MQRFSRQREAILCNLTRRIDHPTADMLYSDLRADDPNISLGTVYRNLSQLSDSGRILRFTDGDRERFDGNSNPHIHFICDICHSVTDVFENYAENAITDVEKALSCEVNTANLILHGRCSDCKQSNKN